MRDPERISLKIPFLDILTKVAIAPVAVPVTKADMTSRNQKITSDNCRTALFGRKHFYR